MKKYNSPEMNISMFDVESVITASGGAYTEASFDAESTSQGGNVATLTKKFSEVGFTTEW